ncbi:MAG TPA: DUF2255 family protein [Solirubrobacterales bacterium]|nr:DUF2255 family protein [Solirubrobacterales bacterium]
MAEWNPTELATIGGTPEVEVSSLREDGTLTKPVTIWAVQVDGELYVRSVRGDAGGWWKAAEGRHEGRLEAGDVGVDVTWEDAVGEREAEVDAAYEAKYGPSSHVDAINAAAAKATTIRVIPR